MEQRRETSEQQQRTARDNRSESKRQGGRWHRGQARVLNIRNLPNLKGIPPRYDGKASEKDPSPFEGKLGCDGWSYVYAIYDDGVSMVDSDCDGLLPEPPAKSILLDCHATSIRRDDQRGTLHPQKD